MLKYQSNLRYIENTCLLSCIGLYFSVWSEVAEIKTGPRAGAGGSAKRPITLTDVFGNRSGSRAPRHGAHANLRILSAGKRSEPIPCGCDRRSVRHRTAPAKDN